MSVGVKVLSAYVFHMGFSSNVESRGGNRNYTNLVVLQCIHRTLSLTMLTLVTFSMRIFCSYMQSTFIAQLGQCVMSVAFVYDRYYTQYTFKIWLHFQKLAKCDKV